MARATLLLLLLSLCALAAARKYQGFDEDRGKHSDDEGAGSAPPTSPNDDIFDLWIFPRGCLGLCSLRPPRRGAPSAGEYFRQKNNP